MIKGIEQICVIGLGYIGLPTSAILANLGYKVLGVDTNSKVLETVSQGKIHIVEPELDILVKAAVNSGFLEVGSKPCKANIFIITVPTPFKENHQPDLSFVEAATQSIAPYLKAGDLVILESTSPVGTTEKIVELLGTLRTDLKMPNALTGTSGDLAVAYCPERVLPGQILRELVENDRVVGGITANCTQRTREFYASFVRGDILTTNSKSAEMVKLSENAYRDVNIAFSNELSIICEKFGIDAWEVIKLANHHPRVKILNPGPGVGGHCISVDPWFIVSAAPEQARLIKTAREVNDSKPQYVLKSIKKAIEEIKAAGQPVDSIALLGLAFKADVDDLRESPAIGIAIEVARFFEGEVCVVEPHVSELPKSLATFKNVVLSDLSSLQRAKVVVMLVDHKSFKVMDRSLIQGKKLIDTRGVWGRSPL